MKKYLRTGSLLLFTLWFLLYVPTILIVQAQSAVSNCVVTDVGVPPANSLIPPECTGGAVGCASEADKVGLVERVLAEKGKRLTLTDATMEGDIKNLLKCNTVALIASLLDLGVNLRITSLVSDHDPDGGFHPKGQAMDLGYHVDNPGDGLKIYNFLYTRRAEAKVIQVIWNNPPDQPGIDPNKECIGQSDRSGGPGTTGNPVNCNAFYKPATMSGHSNHIHTSVSL